MEKWMRPHPAERWMKEKEGAAVLSEERGLHDVRGEFYGYQNLIRDLVLGA